MIPFGNSEFNLRIIIISHAGIGGHRGWQTTKAKIQAHNFSDTLSTDTYYLCKSSIHCIWT